MGGGDLNMKKSWHPALLVNQERVWKAQKAANEEKKMLAQLRKERDEERQLAELQRMQETATGKKRVEKLDWMYAAPGANDGAMGGRMSERELEDYLLGKKRVDEVLAQGDKNVGNLHKEFIAVQNANTARDTAAKIREDPLLAIKKQEQAALAALMNRPDIRRQLKATKSGIESKEEKEERRARRKATREERKRAKRDHRSRYDSRSPRSDYSDERSHKQGRNERESVPYDSQRHNEETRSYSRPDGDRQRRHNDSHHIIDRHVRDSYPKSRRDYGAGSRSQSPDRERLNDHSTYRDRDDRHHDSLGYASRVNHRSSFDAHHKSEHSVYSPPVRPTTKEVAPEASNSLDDMRAARLAAMSASADDMHRERSKTIARRTEEERTVFEREERARSRYHKDEAAGLFMRQQEQLGLAESLQRRGGKGLLRDI